MAKAFYDTALRNDPQMGLAPVHDRDVIDNEIAYSNKMMSLFNDKSVQSFTDVRLQRYFYLPPNRTQYDRSTGIVYSKVKVRTGKSLNKSEMLKYTRPIYEEWASIGNHSIFVDRMQKINQYKIGCFLNISPSTNFDELANDFNQEAKHFLEQLKQEAIKNDDQQTWQDLNKLTCEFRIFLSVLWSRTRRKKLYEAPVGWIMASNTSSTIGTRTIKHLREKCQLSTEPNRILDRKMDIIVMPETIFDAGLVDTCKTCNELYVSLASVEYESLSEPEFEVDLQCGKSVTLRTLLLDMTVSDTDSQQLVMHVDSKILSDTGIVLTCHNSMEQLLIDKVTNLENYLESVLTKESFQSLYDSEDKGEGSYTKKFNPATKIKQSKRKSQYTSSHNQLQMIMAKS